MVIQLRTPNKVITVTVGLFFFKLLFYKVKSELLLLLFGVLVEKS